MSDHAVARTDQELQMLESMVDCAHRLGMTFGRAAEAEADLPVKLQLFDAFHRSFLAVRMGIRLSMTLRAAPRAAAPAAVERERAERERAEREPIEVEQSDSLERLEAEPVETERERERDYEAVSLPRFLATLGVVAADAGRLRDRLSADAAHTLPTLRGLLARAKADPPGPTSRPPRPGDVLVRPPPTGSRAALLGSASASARVALLGPRLARPPPPHRR